jgi:hypothetical protein
MAMFISHEIDVKEKVAMPSLILKESLHAKSDTEDRGDNGSF